MVTKAKRPALDLAALDPDLRAQLQKKIGNKAARKRANDFPKDAVRRYAFRCLGALAELSQAQRKRVLAQAMKLNSI